MWTTLRFSVLSLLLSFVLLSGSAAAWTTNEWVGVLEAVIGVNSVERKAVTPSGDTCDNCGGSGRVGDGTVSVECAACEGTGKKKKESKEEPAATAASNFQCRGTS